jgi:hypothetical protein
MPRRGKHAWQDGEDNPRSPQGWFARLLSSEATPYRVRVTEGDGEDEPADAEP